MTIRHWLSALALLILPLTSLAATSAYRYDSVHSQIIFSIDHNGYSRPFGRLHIARGWLRFDPANWSDSATELDIDLSSVDMGDDAWNRAVRKSSLLDTDHYRYAHFVSTGIEQRDVSHGIIHGKLTLHGVTQPLDVAFTLNRHGITIYGLHNIAGFSGTASLDRRAFGITAFSGSIGHDVAIWLEIEAIRDDRALQDTTAPTKEGNNQP